MLPLPSPDRRLVTERTLRRDLTRIGVEPETTLVVHSSLSSIGWVLGGATTVIRALLTALGDEGTLVMPAATPHCADPATRSAPEIPDAWLDEVRENLPLFDARTTPTAMGTIPETFRTWPGTLRSEHPLEWRSSPTSAPSGAAHSSWTDPRLPRRGSRPCLPATERTRRRVPYVERAFFVEFLAGREGWVAGWTHHLGNFAFRSTNGGRSWRQEPLPAGSGLDPFGVIDARVFEPSRASTWSSAEGT